MDPKIEEWQADHLVKKDEYCPGEFAWDCGD